MIFYSDKNVYEAALERFRYIFREFYGKRKIVVTMSGGKDSTVVLNLAHEVMKEMGIEKIPVLFLDQEAETPMTIEYIRYIMHLPWVEPYWIQSYFQEWNASKGEWFNVWGPGEKWIREKEPDSYGDLEIPHNQYFSKTLDQVHRMLFGKDYLTLGGVRIEESPARLSGLTRGECLPGITWEVVADIIKTAHREVWYSTLFGIGRFMMYGITSSATSFRTVSSITISSRRSHSERAE